MSLLCRYGFVGALCVAWLGAQGCSKDDLAGLGSEAAEAELAPDPALTEPEATPPVDPEGANNGETEPGVCGAVGASCTENSQCCDRACAVEDDGTGRCVAARFCKAQGAACTQAADCCSFACGSDGTCGGSDDLCAPSGADSPCDAASDCCSGRCEAASEDGPTVCTALAGGTCQSLGERCTTEGTVEKTECCSGWCVAMGTTSDGSSDLRCGIVSACRSTNDICDEASDCCSGLCDSDTHRCVVTKKNGGGPGSLLVGEPCVENNNCRSQTCASSYLGGPRTCQRLGGCLTQYELCERDEDCCSWDPLNFCNARGGSEGGCKEDDGVKTCAERGSSGHGAPGEVCGTGEGSGTGTCCGATGPVDPSVCRVTSFGTNRCFGSAIDTKYEDGEPCVFGEQCESNLCLPYEDQEAGESGLRCEAEPLEAGETCTVDIDCVSLMCDDFTCQEAPAPGEEPLECLPLGASCEADDACCSSFCNTWLNTCATRSTLI